MAWIPELNRLPSEWAHKLWEAPARPLAEAGIELGSTYPLPIIDHREARSRALEALQQIKKRCVQPRHGATVMSRACINDCQPECLCPCGGGMGRLFVQP